MDLKDRVALVAGGTGLLGTAIARALAGAGADFLFEDRGARSLKLFLNGPAVSAKSS